MRYSSTIVCVICGLAEPAAAQTEITSAIESVTVYPDGATVTRRIQVDLPQDDSVLRAADFPPTLDPASLRIEGEARARLTIGGIDARPPRAIPQQPDPAQPLQPGGEKPARQRELLSAAAQYGHPFQSIELCLFLCQLRPGRFQIGLEDFREGRFQRAVFQRASRQSRHQLLPSGL